MTYLEPIQKAGFRLHLADDGRLLVEPFSRLSPRQRAFLKRHKAEIIAELTAARAANQDGIEDASATDRLAMRPCPTCGDDTLHQAIEGQWRCARQHPATLDEALRQACQGLTVTPDQVRDAMSPEDLADWGAGRIPPPMLEAFARAMDARLRGEPPAAPETSDPLAVVCWTPAGRPVVVKARDEQHAAWLRRVNPPPDRRRGGDWIEGSYGRRYQIHGQTDGDET